MSSIRGLLVFFGPVLLPKAISYYRKAQNAPKQQGLTVQPVPKAASRALALLAVAVLALLLLSLPLFSPENVFHSTQSRLQIPTDVLFNRLATLRAGGALTPADEVLRARFVNLESRLLYLQYGPDVLAGCTFCSPDEPTVYYLYAATGVLAAHVANLFLLGLATSRPLSGRYGGPWRRTATLAAAGLAGVDLYLLSAYDHQANARALRLPEIDAFHWRARAYRLLALAGLDALLAFAVYLSSTNRAFAAPASAAGRAAGVAAQLASLKSKLNALGIMRNTLSRDEELRGRNAMYWAQEGSLMREVMEEREVIESVNDALENGRLDISSITRDAETYADSITSALKAGMVEESKKQR